MKHRAPGPPADSGIRARSWRLSAEHLLQMFVLGEGAAGCVPGCGRPDREKRFPAQRRPGPLPGMGTRAFTGPRIPQMGQVDPPGLPQRRTNQTQGQRALTPGSFPRWLGTGGHQLSDRGLRAAFSIQPTLENPDPHSQENTPQGEGLCSPSS